MKPIMISQDEMDLINRGTLPKRLLGSITFTRRKTQAILYDVLEERLDFGSSWHSATEIKDMCKLEEWSLENIGKALNALGFCSKACRKKSSGDLLDRNRSKPFKGYAVKVKTEWLTK